MRIALRPGNIDTFTCRLKADLVSDDKIGHFLLQFPKETLFKLLLSETFTSRRYTFEIIKQIFNPRYSKPLILSASEEDKLNSLCDQVKDYLHELDDLDHFARSPGTSTEDFQLVPFLKLLRWALTGLHRFDRPTFDFCMALYTRFDASKKFAVNHHLLQTISVLVRFPPAFLSPFFVQFFSKTMQIAEAARENCYYAKFFIRFGRYLEYITSDQLSVIVSHPKIAAILGDLPGYDHRSKCWPKLVGALECRTGDPACAAALAQVLNGTASSISITNLATYLPLLQTSVYLKTDTIERFLDVLESAFTLPTTSIEHFRVACQFQSALLAHESVRTRIDPCDPFFFKQVVVHITNDPEKLTIVRGFFRELIHRNGRPFVKALQNHLRPVQSVEQAILILAAAVDAGTDVSEAFRDARAPTLFMLDAIAELVPTGEPVPKWAINFLIESAKTIQYGSVDRQNREFVYRVIEEMEIEEAKQFLRNSYRGDGSLIGNDQVIAQAVFKRFPAEKEALLEVFPLDDEDRFSSPCGRIYDHDSFDSF
jgi:hypothetical protein